MISWIVGAGLVGLSLVTLGLVGRRAGHEPRCRKCGFDLSGLPDTSAGTCPECGADLSQRRAVITQPRAHIRWLVAGGACACTLSLALLATAGVGHYRFVHNRPSWVLLLQARHSPIDEVGAILNQIEYRHDSGRLDDADVRPVIDHALLVFMDSSITWTDALRDSWGEFLVWAQEREAMSASQLEAFLVGAFPLAVEPAPAVCDHTLRFGAGIEPSPRLPKQIDNPLDVEMTPASVTMLGERHGFADTRPIEERRPTYGEYGVLLRRGGYTGSRMHWTAPAPRRSGVHDVRVEFSTTYKNTVLQESMLHRWHAPKPGPPLLRVSQSCVVRVRATGPGRTITPVIDQPRLNAAARAFRAIIWFNEHVYSDNRVLHSGNVYCAIGSAPAGGEFDMWLVSPNGTPIQFTRRVVIPTSHEADRRTAGELVEGFSLERAAPLEPGELGVQTPRRWNTAPFNASEIPGEGWRVVLEPLDLHLMRHVSNDDPLRDDWVPPATIKRRLVFQTAPMSVDQVAFLMEHGRRYVLGEKDAGPLSDLGEILHYRFIRSIPEGGRYMLVASPDAEAAIADITARYSARRPSEQDNEEPGP